MKKKRGRPKTGKLESQTTILKLKCKVCGRKRNINTTTPEKYSKEIKENYICLFCKGRNDNFEN